MSDGDTDRTERATAKKRQDARKKGQVVVSQDLNRAFQMMIVLIVFQQVGYHIYLEFMSMLRVNLSDRLVMDINESTALYTIKDTFLKAVELLLPFFVSIVVLMVAINIAQVGFKISFETVRLNIGKLNPIKGLKKIFSLRSAVKLIGSVLKVVVLAVVVYASLKDRMSEIGSLGGCSLTEILTYCFSLLFLILFRLGLALIVMGLFDYMYQKWQYEKDLKMTKQEVKDELKQTLGDPLVKKRVRQVQFEMFKQRLMEQVPEATVVVTNPTHYAVAIKYDRGVMDAPLVVAKGMNLIAERIKEIARDHTIPIVENRVLAQTLYRTVDVGREVPPDLYRAVAEVLTYVYKLKGKA